MLKHMKKSTNVKLTGFILLQQLVMKEGKTLFHAGDLQWWHWEEEPKHWNDEMEREFKKEGAKLMGRKIDVAFLVLDPRQESYFWWGFDWWMRTMQVQLAFPMHSWESFSLTQKLKALPCSEPYRDRVMEIFYPAMKRWTKPLFWTRRKIPP